MTSPARRAELRERITAALKEFTARTTGHSRWTSSSSIDWKCNAADLLREAAETLGPPPKETRNDLPDVLQAEGVESLPGVRVLPEVPQGGGAVDLRRGRVETLGPQATPDPPPVRVEASSEQDDPAEELLRALDTMYRYSSDEGCPLFESHRFVRPNRAIDVVRVWLGEASAEWQPIATAPQMRKVIVFYRNALGKGRCVMACYYKAHSLEMDDDYSDVGTYDEATGESYAPEGWYEEHDHDSPIMPLQEEPTHWMPLPVPPQDAPQ